MSTSAGKIRATENRGRLVLFQPGGKAVETGQTMDGSNDDPPSKQCRISAD